jgi:hypothetical protein
VGRHGDDLAAVLSLDFFLALDVVDIPIAELPECQQDGTRSVFTVIADNAAFTCVFRSRSAFSLYRKPSNNWGA